MPEAQETIAVRIELGDLNYVRQLIDILSGVQRAYNALYSFFDFSLDFEDTHRSWHWYWPEWLPVPPSPLFLLTSKRARPGKLVSLSTGAIEDFSSYVHPHDRLVLARCRINSPGYLDFPGRWNPLEVLRQWAQDRHERRNDRDFREKAEKEKLRLENELLRNAVIRERMEILREIRLSRSVRKRFINDVLIDPMKPSQAHMDNGNIQTIRAVSPQHEDEGFEE